MAHIQHKAKEAKMLNLFCGECYKLRKHKPFYICTLIGVCIALMLYGTLFMVDNLEQMESQETQTDFSVTVSVNKETGSTDTPESNSAGSTIPMSQQIGIVGVIEQMLSGSFVSFIMILFVCIFVIGEHSNGTVKNVVGKGYSRKTVYLSKLLATEMAALLMTLIILGGTLLFGAFFFGKSGIQSMNWENLAAFTGMHLLFAAALTAIATLIGEITRSLAAGIPISLAVVMFSTSLTTGLDLLFQNLNLDWKPSDYWLLDLQTTALAEIVKQDFIIRGTVLSLAWLLAAVLLGMLHFNKTDIK